MKTHPTAVAQRSPSPAPNGPAPVTRRVLAQSRYESLCMLRNGEQLVLTLFIPVAALLVLVNTGFLDRLGVPRIEAAFPVALTLAILGAGFTGQGIATGFDRRYGVLTHAATTPLGRSGLLAGKLLAVSVVVLIQLLLVGFVALLLGLSITPMELLAMLPALCLGVTSLTSAGLFIAGAVRPEATLAITNLLWVVLAGVGGILLPAALLPSPLSQIVSFLPTSALADALRSAVSSGTMMPGPLLIMSLWTLLCGLGVLKTFKWS